MPSALSHRLQERIDAVTARIEAVCTEHLTDEYAALACAAAGAVAALPSTAFDRGKTDGWACGCVRAVGYVNFLSDPDSPTHRRTAEIAPLFGVSEATAAKRDHDVRDALGLVRFDPHWTLPSGLASNPMVWTLVLDGIPQDVRAFSAEAQRALVEAGYLPFAPADPASTPPRPRWPEPEAAQAAALQASLDPDAPRLRLVVTLDDVEPVVSRTVEVPSDLSLDGLHEVIQIAMGWEDYHLHSFRVGSREIGRPEILDGVEHEFEVRVAAVLPTRRARLQYMYDSGDGWEHTVRLDASLPPDPDAPLFVCVDGAGACPPEDCGGPWGYQALLEILADPSHPEHEERMEWTGGPIDPAAFDLEATNRALSGG